MFIEYNDIKGILDGKCRHPFEILGVHECGAKKRVVCFYPDACKAFITIKGTRKKLEMECLYGAGFFGIELEAEEGFRYILTLEYPDGNTFSTEDSYAFDPFGDNEQLDLFNRGINYEVYRQLGANPCTVNGCKGVRFAVWAPNAQSVSVTGDFNLWDKRRNIMEFDESHGIYTLFVPGITDGAIYKYAVTGQNGKTVFKADPYAKSAEKRPGNASRYYDISKYRWGDGMYLRSRAGKDYKAAPINVYEVHLGSWKKPSEEDGSFYNYRELAVMLCDYVKDMGYTHVELLPVMEHPFDGSWGYQVTGYYAPTARFGTPEDFMYFVDYMHKNKIGVIIDWVPAHFPKDEFGLAKFDGTCLYEHADPRKGEHPHWGTLIYNTERPEVSNFLIANALYWVEQYHIDGIRMDAVASMLYLDYGKEAGEWIPNKNGGRENLDTIEFLKHLNSMMNKRNPNVLMIAEESTAWPNVTGVVEEKNSLGFNLKWNMGWMNDFLKYMQTDPLFKKGVHGMLTFSMMYAYSEDFILVLSHDEVVHGKCSLINKMPGDYREKFASLRTAYGFMTGHPGKKLLFMGQEFAQFAEWNENKSLDWMLPEKYETHREMQDFVRDLNHLYTDYPALYELDFDPSGFKWMSCMDADHSIVSFIRRDRKSNILLFVCNFTPVKYDNYRQAVPFECKCSEILNSDNVKYGGESIAYDSALDSERIMWDGQDNSISFTLPGLSVVIFKVKAK